MINLKVRPLHRIGAFSVPPAIASYKESQQVTSWACGPDVPHYCFRLKSVPTSRIELPEVRDQACW